MSEITTIEAEIMGQLARRAEATAEGVAALRQQRDDLLKTLREAREWIADHEWIIAPPILARIDAVLKKAGG